MGNESHCLENEEIAVLSCNAEWRLNCLLWDLKVLLFLMEVYVDHRTVVAKLERCFHCVLSDWLLAIKLVFTI